uniref:cytochrome c oxidase subunit 2 n=1 Tax=Bakuella subtropica TaxID=1295181 RepID=UPI0023F4DE28|nr:cytochrome c oxidase subunit 2 [Bakuella subtropica]WDY80894.1 cytochrome c oxidase subunit 2 [Bakuella subtropica]
MITPSIEFFDLLDDLFLSSSTPSLPPLETFFFVHEALPAYLSLKSMCWPLSGSSDFFVNSVPAFANHLITYHYSIPTTKLMYPEPFTASASFMHSDLWFLHILLYQYWLWFVFVFLIIFFFITFLCTVRWCNMRIRPRRETRGVSRSKCGDLITACVPVSWATSIIIHESTDAIDYYDGFGTGELVIGIRAYQWGWEYYYPRNLDLNFKQNTNYSAFIGNSLQYISTTSTRRHTSSFWNAHVNHLSQTDINLLPLLWLVGKDPTVTPLTTSSTSLSLPNKNFNSFKLTTMQSKLVNSSTNSWFSYNSPLPLSPLFQSNPLSTNDIFFSLFEHSILSSSPLTEKEQLPSDLVFWQKKQLPSLAKTNAISPSPTYDFPSSLTLFSKNSSPLSFITTLSLFSSSSLLLQTERFGKLVTVPSFITKTLNLTNFPSTSLSSNLQITKITRGFHPLLPPFPFNHTTSSLALMDNSYSPQTSEIPLPFLHKEEITPEYLLFDFYFTNHLLTPSNWFMKSLEMGSWLKSLFPLTPFTFYADYDFLNWQYYDLFEQMFFDSISPSSINEETLALKDYFFQNIVTLPFTKPFSFQNRLFCSKRLLLTSIFANSSNTKTAPSSFTPLHLAFNLNYKMNTLITIMQKSLDESLMDGSYVVLNSSRWSNNTTNSQFVLFPLSMKLSRIWLEAANNFSDQFSYALPFTHLSNFSHSSSPLFLNLKGLDFTPILRLSSKNINVTAQALQKVARTRFDELRAFTPPSLFSHVEASIPFISSRTPTGKSIITKNHVTFSTKFTTVPSWTFFQDEERTFNSFNFPSFELPFFLGLKSDPAKHLWIDWFSKWSFIDIQPSSSARYAILGLPYYNKIFNFPAADLETFNDAENYFMRLARARKKPLQSWLTSPLLYERNSHLFSHIIQTLINHSQVSIFSIETDLLSLSFFLNTPYRITSFSTMTPATSNFWTFSRSSGKNYFNNDNYAHYTHLLLDILTKRELLARLLGLQYSSTQVNSPLYQTTPDNLIFSEWKNFSSLSSFSDTFLLTSLLQSKNNTPSPLVTRNPYVPLRKGINNLLRLHATGAIAFPCEIRLQLLASSKDVIHSWAVPSAGIKIDCVPGYSSHKIMIFLLSGIFWGQCMEICGRYHHWMPIVVYFMKRDMFILWCTHFVFFDIEKFSISSHNTSSPTFANTVFF